MNNKQYSIPVYVDVLTQLLNRDRLSDNDIKQMIEEQIFQGDPVWEDIVEDVQGSYPDEMADAVEKQMGRIDVKEYITVQRNAIDIDYSETAEVADYRCIALNIPFEFELSKFAYFHPDLTVDEIEK